MNRARLYRLLWTLRTLPAVTFLFHPLSMASEHTETYRNARVQQAVVDLPLSAIPELPLPTLSARHIRWHEPSNTELLQVNIELSPLGLRIRPLNPDQQHQEMLQDFAGNEAWLINHRRQVAHRLPVEDEPTLASNHPGFGASFLSREPCGGMLGKSDAGDGMWRGRAVGAWHCEDENQTVVTIEFIDNEYGIVVYRRTSSGQIDELRDLRSRQYATDYFRLNDRLKSVSRYEFFSGAPPIPVYEDND